MKKILSILLLALILLPVLTGCGPGEVKADSTVKIYTSREFSKDGLIKIAASIPGYEKTED